jgi:HK97 family phage portal protein
MATRAESADPPSNVERAIARVIAQRSADFTLADALSLPPVARAVDLLCSHAATLAVIAYRDGEPLTEQPRVVTRPEAYYRRYDTVYATTYSLVTEGDAFWRITSRDYDGWPTGFRVVPVSEVRTRWDRYGAGALYGIGADEDLPARELVHIIKGRQPGEVRGTSPLRAVLPRLAVIAAAEAFASAYFESGGIPEVVLKSIPELTRDEAVQLRDQYRLADPDNPGAPQPIRVVSGGVDLVFPNVDPASSQLQETRSYAATEVARALGIPGPLMLIETSGSTITYANAQAALTELYRETLYPSYLDSIESAWSDLVPATQAVRFELRELLVADIQTRSAVYSQYIADGVLSAPEVRALEGWPRAPITESPRYTATPGPRPVREVSEVT